MADTLIITLHMILTKEQEESVCDQLLCVFASPLTIEDAHRLIVQNPAVIMDLFNWRSEAELRRGVLVMRKNAQWPLNKPTIRKLVYRLKDEGELKIVDSWLARVFFNHKGPAQLYQVNT